MVAIGCDGVGLGLSAADRVQLGLQAMQRADVAQLAGRIFSTLSGGEQQRTRFARALAHRPGILLLDEATSSVDTETELRVRSALENMVVGRTSVVIAHRLSTIQRADLILVMHKGKLREMGSHQQLLAQRGLYWKLYRLQYRDQELSAIHPTGDAPPLSQKMA